MKSYYARFGSGKASTYTGLTPTFTIWNVVGVSAVVAPGITETPAGSGLYRFQWGTTQSIAFELDGGAALPTSDRYVYGAVDPVDRVDEVIGVIGDSFGSTSVDPSTLVGYAARNLEFNEGNANFSKSSGVWDVYSRGSSTLLREKTLSNSTSTAAKV